LTVLDARKSLIFMVVLLSRFIHTAHIGLTRTIPLETPSRKSEAKGGTDDRRDILL
jgi:hypothetical protein